MTHYWRITNNDWNKSEVVDIKTEKQTMDRLNKLISDFCSSQKLSKILLDKYFPQKYKRL